MNSKTLTETGFSEWIPLKTLTHSNLPKDQGIVIAIVDKELEGKPESDILYIGRTKKPSKRILGGYLAGYGGKNTKKINDMLLCEGYMEKAVISWMQADKPRIMQEELLVKFKEEHGGLPAWNAKKKLVTKAKKASKKAPESEQKEVASSKAKVARRKKAVKAKPAPKPRATRKASAKLEMPPKTETTTQDEMPAESSETKPNSEMTT